VFCRVLSVSRSGYYEWLSRPDSPRAQENALLLKHIERIHAESRGTYGSPRVHAELTLGLGLPVNLKRVGRPRREIMLRGLGDGDCEAGPPALNALVQADIVFGTHRRGCTYPHGASDLTAEQDHALPRAIHPATCPAPVDHPLWTNCQ
jgi:hypothetical protein